MGSMKEFIYQCPNALSNETCDQILKLFHDNEAYHYRGVLGGYSQVNEKVKNTIDFELLNFLKSNPHLDNNILNTLIQSIEDNLKTYYHQLDPSGNIYYFDKIHANKCIHSFLLHKYIKNEGTFTYHNDMYIEKKKNIYRVLNYLWYLNDVEEGGETEFFGYYKIKPEKGKMVIFPSDWLFPHTGKPPISGDKYILTGWIYIAM